MLFLGFVRPKLRSVSRLDESHAKTMGIPKNPGRKPSCVPSINRILGRAKKWWRVPVQGRIRVGNRWAWVNAFSSLSNILNGIRFAASCLGLGPTYHSTVRSLRLCFELAPLASRGRPPESLSMAITARPKEVYRTEKPARRSRGQRNPAWIPYRRSAERQTRPTSPVTDAGHWPATAHEGAQTLAMAC
jgi:hypothetical protein